MPVRSLEIHALEARRFTKDKPGNVRVDHNVSIVNVTPSDRPEGDSVVEFTYTVTYGHLGMIRMEGKLTYEGSGLHDSWRADRKIPNGPLEEIYNVIMDMGSFEALVIAKKLALPPPIPLKIPRIKVEKGKTTGKAVHGPEVA